MEFWLTKWVDSWTWICTDDWLTDSSPVSWLFLVCSQPVLDFVNAAHCFGFTDGHGLASLPRVVTAGTPPPAQLLVEWQIPKISASLVLDSHRPLLADGSNWNIIWGVQVFPVPTVGGVYVCVCVCEGHLGLHSHSEQGVMDPRGVYPCPEE